ncbi:putative wall-associated receptor kinase-like 16 [Juglans microcarpa x Juglans regia]|uniref:putative wall-associated receptor kinase-like 16 n=1 Tax=Juglans microcarpa x Juglans regia TaxID=2249226 RepID=UPI001B7F5271|nr:putative wall-associated receptor kinase-like 16 [Juglans microcarpa x Juglans regia]
MGGYRLHLQVTWVGVLILSEMATSAVAAAHESALPSCLDHCGEVQIPYPFGTSDDCSLNKDFLINCTQSSTGRDQPQIDGIVVPKISMEGQLELSLKLSKKCYNESGMLSSFWRSRLLITTSTFTISNTENMFMAVGCDTYAYLHGKQYNGNFSMGCMSICQNQSNVLNGTCSGIGCCKVEIPKKVSNFSLQASSFRNHTEVWSFNPCSYAFIVKKGQFNFSSDNLSNIEDNNRTLPMVLDWTIGNERCKYAQLKSDYLCGGNSTCDDPENGYGYRCQCKKGYDGNPYLPLGCKDVNECLNPNLNNCTSPKRCINTEGNYTCSCPKWHSGDGRKDGESCTLNLGLVNKTAIASGVGFVVLLVSSTWMYLIIKQRKLIRLRERFFRQNGGVILRQQLSRQNSVETTKIFSAEELKKATNNYHENLIIGEGGFGIVYKGFLSDNRVVAIKKSKLVDKSQIEQFINEVLLLSQINHRNVVKLLGCCLETEVPLLVYEFISRGTLFEHIHHKDRSLRISWEARLKIAAETAEALSYLHCAASPPIIHRDVKSSNILLDDNYTAKVSDFGASRLIPLDQIEVFTLMQGTLGYLDPEYMQTSQLTEKSDVYSFGVILIELLTGEKALSFDRPEEERSLAMHFLSAIKEDRLFEVLEQNLGTKRNEKQLKEVANLARRCIKLKGEDRPTMKEVAAELEGLRKIDKHSWVSVGSNSEEREYLLGETSGSYTYDVAIKSSVVYDSMKDHTMVAFDGGR